MKFTNMLIVCDCPRIIRPFIINCLSPRLRHIYAIVSVLLIQSQTALTMMAFDPKGQEQWGWGTAEEEQAGGEIEGHWVQNHTI